MKNAAPTPKLFKNNNENVSSFLLFWFFSGVTLLTFSSDDGDILIKITIPLVLCTIIQKISTNSYEATPYILFFAVCITSVFGLTEPLTGSHAVSNYPILFGLSFYTASLAYLIKTDKIFQAAPVINNLTISNPLILITGPIALYFRSIKHIKVQKRIKIFGPYVVIGFFYFQILSAPLTAFLPLIEQTDIFSALTFAIIFEIFIYTNFCGLSLIIFGLSGLFGFKIPLNFRQPFSSTNLIDFWRGWHVSLSSVLKALFYNPLKRKFPATVAVFGVFLSSAMWHGVSINFFIWGIFHGAMFSLAKKVPRQKYKFLSLTILIFTVIIGRLIFSDSNFDRLTEKLSFNFVDFQAMEFLFSAPTIAKTALLLSIFLVMIEFFLRFNKMVRQRTYKHLRSPISLSMILILILLLITNDMGVFAVYGQR